MPVTPILALGLAAVLAVPALASPPGWAPAHGWRDTYDWRWEDRREAWRPDRRAYERGRADALKGRPFRVRGEAWSYEAGYRDGLRLARRGDWRQEAWRRDDWGREDWRDAPWRDFRWREACEVRDRGTGGMVVGATLGGVLGSQIARNDPTAGAIVGAATGGLIGRSIDRRDGRC